MRGLLRFGPPIEYPSGHLGTEIVDEMSVAGLNYGFGHLRGSQGRVVSVRCDDMY